MKKIFILILFFCFLPRVYAAGLQVSPSKLNLIATSSKITQAKIRVMNPNPDVQLFEIFADNFPDGFVILPQSFTLEAGEGRVVEIQIDAKKLKKYSPDAVFSGQISVISKPLKNEGMDIGAGVKIPFEIVLKTDGLGNATAWFLQFLLLGFAAAVGGFAIIFFLKRKKRKNTSQKY